VGRARGSTLRARAKRVKLGTAPLCWRAVRALTRPGCVSAQVTKESTWARPSILGWKARALQHLRGGASLALSPKP
jgi:hypothetical protein